jgi:hypothetical protein
MEAKPQHSLTDAPSSVKLRQWEVLGMSRATWYRRGQPTTKPEKRGQRELAKELGISVRTLQRDRSAAVDEALAAIRAEGREVSVETVNERFPSLLGVKWEKRGMMRRGTRVIIDPKHYYQLPAEVSLNSLFFMAMKWWSEEQEQTADAGQ